MKAAVRLAAGLCLGACILAWGASSYGQEMSKEDMMQLIQQLKQRVDDLEKKVEGVEGQVPANRALSERRMNQLEEKLEAKKELADNDFRVYWKSGLRLDSGDGNYKLKIGGRIQTDFAWFDQDKNDLWLIEDAQDGAEFRRARLYISGDIYDSVEFKAQYDFAGGDADFKDVYLALNDIPTVGQLKIGHFKEPFSLEELTSSKYITFMERALPNVFSPSRNTGVQLMNNFFDGRMTAAAGFFYDADGYGEAGDEDRGWNFTTRLTGLPYYAEEGRKLVHLGVSYSHQNPDEDIRYRQRPEAHSAPRYIDTGSFRADAVDLWAFEAALVYGPFSLQSEYFYTDVDTDWLCGDQDFDGWYVYGSYFLTGEHRPYKTSSGKFDRVKPNKNFNLWGDGEKGWGAWEVALRYSELDLNTDRALRGGQEDNITAALNWYLNPNTRLMLNYIYADVEHDLYEGDMQTLQARFQVDF